MEKEKTALKTGIRNAAADIVLFMDAEKCLEKLYLYLYIPI